MTNRTAAIVGAGIGGLAAALTLARAGFSVTLVERRTGFSEVGAGLQLSPNASRVLAGLGLGPALARAATEPDRAVIRSGANGREIGAMALGPAMRKRYGAPYLVVHRADLQTILLDAARSRPGIRFLMGRACEGVEETAGGVALALRREAGASERLEADLAIGADGVRSRLRAHVESTSPERCAPLFTGYHAWRATIPREAAPRALAGDETTLWLTRDAHVVHYPIAGGKRLNIVAVTRAGEPVEGWSAPGEASELRARFYRVAPELAALLAIPDDWLVWSLADRPAGPMARGRVALLGDAAHPVLPFLAQGAALAIEDAERLAARLGRDDGAVVAALAAYADERRPRALAVQKAARANGRIYHAGGLVAIGRDLVMKRLGADGMARRYDWLYGWGRV
ncbi:FAD-dependent monooxygenase [Salinarimonas sp.]|uniref:FAD-dependent monooxygenase n=1 Tax=Salinarimonas sp. TaxID=2766526 RepID=UPI00391D2573